MRPAITFLNIQLSNSRRWKDHRHAAATFGCGAGIQNVKNIKSYLAQRKMICYNQSLSGHLC